MADLSSLRNTVDLLSAEAKRAERNARVMKRLAAEAREEIDTLQSEEGTSDRGNAGPHRSTE